MQRERIREQLGFLEEQLERLQTVATSNSRSSIDDSITYQFDESILIEEMNRSFNELQSLVQEETLRQKSMTAQDFLSRVIRCLITKSTELGFDIAVTHYGEGRVSLEMVEISMSAILSCIHASLRSYKGMSRAHRMKQRLFYPYSFHLEVRASLDEMRFRIIDDGQGYAGDLRSQFDSEKHFKGIRGEIGKNGGWFKSRSYGEFGGMIEFKMPLKRSRFETLVLGCADGEVLVPGHSVSEICEGKFLPPEEKEEIYAKLSAGGGLVSCNREEARASACVVRMGVADFQLWVACSGAMRRVVARRHSADGFVESDSWYTQFGIFHEQGLGMTLPLLDGDVLLRFHGRTAK